MKEMSSFYDDTEKRIGVFFGLGAFLLSSLFAIFQGLTPEGFLLRGVAVLIIFSLLGWAYGAWLKRTIAATAPKEELPSNVERRTRNAESLDEGSVVVLPGTAETEVMEDPDTASSSVVDFTLPEFTPMDMAAVTPPASADNTAAPI